MNDLAKPGNAAELRDYLAIERTFLAWIRTGLALMGFGFVGARFGLFLQQLQFFQHLSAAPSYGLSLWFGTALIGVGVLVFVFSTWNYLRLVRDLERGHTFGARPSTQIISIALFLAIVGLAMAIYLLSVRDSSGTHSQSVGEGATMQATNNGIIDRPSNHSVDETVNKLKGILQAKSVTLFALVDHSGEAEKVGMKMRPTKLLIFGNPKAGTPLMLASPSIAIDLPLKILVWEDALGKTWVSHNSAEYLQTRHGFPAELIGNLDVVETLAAKAAE